MSSTAIKSDDKTRADINKNFIIRYYFKDEPKKTYLVSAGRYKDLVGKKIADEHFEGAMTSGKDVYERNIRGHINIKFISR